MLFTSKRQQPLPPAIYPVRGLLHLAHNPELVKPILVSAVKASAVSLVVIVPLVKYGFGPQSRLLERIYSELRPQDTKQWFVGPGVAVTTGLLTLAESFAVVGQLTQYFVGSVRERLFDAILQERKDLPPLKAAEVKKEEPPKTAEQVVESLNMAVKQAKESIPSSIEDAKEQAHRLLSPVNIMLLNAQKEDSWELFFVNAILFVGTLPLNLIPVFGPAAFLGIQGLSRGGAAHKRYFNVHNWSRARRQRQIEHAFWQYHQFGVVATFLEMIPFAGFIFSYTNEIG